MDSGFTIMQMGISIFIVLTILAFAAPTFWEEIGIAGGHDAYFGVWEGKL
jgi:hypothetical protein